MNPAWHIFHYKVVLFGPSQYLIQSVRLTQPDSVGVLGFCSYASLALFECLTFSLSNTWTCSDWAENPNTHIWMAFKVMLSWTRVAWCKTSHAFVALVLQLITLYMFVLINLKFLLFKLVILSWSFFTFYLPGSFYGFGHSIEIQVTSGPFGHWSSVSDCFDAVF